MSLDNLRRLIRPLQARVSNLVARAVVQLVDDSAKQQLVQLGVMAGEVIDDGERFEPYGFTSVPLVGAEAVAVFPGGDRGHPLVVVVSDRRHRPTGGEPGEVSVYNHTGARALFTTDGDVVVTPAPGRQVLLGGAAATSPVALKSDLAALKVYLDAHVHTGVTSGGASTGTAAPSPAPASATKVKAE